MEDVSRHKTDIFQPLKPRHSPTRLSKKKNKTQPQCGLGSEIDYFD
jgi:hypothetical protein